MTSSGELFHTAARALFGDLYVAPMAHFLDRDKNLIGKWRNDKTPVPAEVWSWIEAALRARRQEIERAHFEVSQQLSVQRDIEQRGPMVTAGIGVVPSRTPPLPKVGPSGFVAWTEDERRQLQTELEHVCEAAAIPGQCRVTLRTLRFHIEVPGTLEEHQINAIMKWWRAEVNRLRPLIIQRGGGDYTLAVEPPMQR